MLEPQSVDVISVLTSQRYSQCIDYHSSGQSWCARPCRVESFMLEKEAFMRGLDFEREEEKRGEVRRSEGK